jgi:hypothetical protein
MSVYADTSLLISYYVTDANSPRAQVLMRATTRPLPFTGLHRLELRNALALGVFRQVLTLAQARATWNDVERDVRSGRLVPQPVNWVPIFRIAAQWAASHTATLGSRSLDVLHVVLARKLTTSDFLSFDVRQRSLAQVVGLTVKP